jgi:LuxR family maltose regulon positive regulatory protein
MRTAVAALRLASDDPQAAADALAPVLDGSLSGVRRVRMVTTLLLEARARDALGDQATAGQVLERALDITASSGILLPFLLDAAPALLERHRRYRTAHPALISQILDLLPKPTLLPARHEGPAGPGGMASSPARAGPAGSALRLVDPLSKSEIRVLRYMPTNLSAPEIARELSVSVHTVRTHVRHLFAKLGAHRRTEAVARARVLGLLAPSPSPTRPEAHSRSGYAA